MPIALLVGALAVVAFDLLPLAHRVPVDPDVGLELLQTLPRWALAFPLVCGAWGALGEALSQHIEARRGPRVGHWMFAGYFAAPLWACIVPLFRGAAIGASPLRWPGMALALTGTTMGLACAHGAAC